MSEVPKCQAPAVVDGLFDGEFLEQQNEHHLQDSTLKTGPLGPGTESLLISRLGALNP